MSDNKNNETLTEKEEREREALRVQQEMIQAAYGPPPMTPEQLVRIERPVMVYGPPSMMNSGGVFMGLGLEKMMQQSAPADTGKWVCAKCSTENTGKFCTECGEPYGWTCSSCGAMSRGKFCTECGTPKPVQLTEDNT